MPILPVFPLIIPVPALLFCDVGPGLGSGLRRGGLKFRAGKVACCLGPDGWPVIHEVVGLSWRDSCQHRLKREHAEAKVKAAASDLKEEKA